MSTTNSHLSVPLEPVTAIEERLEKKISVKIFSNSVINIKEQISNFKDGNKFPEKVFDKCKMLTTLLKSFDTFVNIAINFTSFTLSDTRIA